MDLCIFMIFFFRFAQNILARCPDGSQSPTPDLKKMSNHPLWGQYYSIAEPFFLNFWGNLSAFCIKC